MRSSLVSGPVIPGKLPYGGGEIHHGSMTVPRHGPTPALAQVQRIRSQSTEIREIVRMASPRTGGCLCGAIRYESAGDVMFALRCHCRDCQRQSGAASVAAIRVPAAQFILTKGTPKRFVAQADSGNEITRAFCGDCGTPLFVQVATRPDVVGLRVCTLDDPGWFRPEADIFVKSAQPWEPVDVAVPQYPDYPPGRSYPVAAGQ
jgi:hypothetical protein